MSLDDDDGHKQQFIASFGLEVGLLQVDGGEAERRLLNTLMEQYNKLERPVYNESQAVQLKFGLTLQQIIDVVSAVLLPVMGGGQRNLTLKSYKH